MTGVKSTTKCVKATEKAEAHNISQKNTMRAAVKSIKTAVSSSANNENELVNLAIKLISRTA